MHCKDLLTINNADEALLVAQLEAENIKRKELEEDDLLDAGHDSACYVSRQIAERLLGALESQEQWEKAVCAVRKHLRELRGKDVYDGTGGCGPVKMTLARLQCQGVLDALFPEPQEDYWRQCDLIPDRFNDVTPDFRIGLERLCDRN